MISKIRNFAIKAHGDQMYGEFPYIFHLDQVVQILENYGINDDTHLSIAYLHDLLEDTIYTDIHLINIISQEILISIKNLTDEPGKNRQERKQKTYIKLSNLKPSSPELIVKIADRIANVTFCIKTNDKRRLKMYKKEHQSFKSAIFRENQPLQMWYELEKLLNF